MYVNNLISCQLPFLWLYDFFKYFFIFKKKIDALFWEHSVDELLILIVYWNYYELWSNPEVWKHFSLPAIVARHLRRTLLLWKCVVVTGKLSSKLWTDSLLPENGATFMIH